MERGQNYFQNGQIHYQNGQTTSTYSTTSSLVNSITIAFGPWRHTPENKFLGGDLPAQPPRMCLRATIATLREADLLESEKPRCEGAQNGRQLPAVHGRREQWQEQAVPVDVQLHHSG